MLRLTDTLRLAGTKLRTRKIRTSITVVISGLLFALLTAALVLTQSALNNLAQFDKGSLNQRYFLMTTVYQKSNSLHIATDPAVIKRAEALNTQYIADRTAAAKRLGLPYDTKSEPVLTQKSAHTEETELNIEHPAARKAIIEAAKAIPQLSPQEVNAVAAQHGAIAHYDVATWQPSGSLSFMAGGKESFSEKQSSPIDQWQESSPKEQFHQAATRSHAILDNALLGTFLLDGTEVKAGEIPVIVSYQHAESMLDLSPLNPTQATREQRIERMKLLRERAGELTYQLCYRNQASHELLSKAITQQQESEAQKKTPKPEYIAPAVQYQLPSADSCGAVTVAKDTRDAATKRLDTLKEQFDAQFTPRDAHEPVQHKLTFRVIGLIPSDHVGISDSASSLLQQLIAPQFSRGDLIIPRQSLAKSSAQPLLQQLDTSTAEDAILQARAAPYLYEFPAAHQARSYSKVADCMGIGEKKGGLCAHGSVIFTHPVGSNALVIDDTRRLLTPVTLWTFLGVTILAAFILLIIIARTIADSRRESAVFRALGATRFAISQIYLTYAIFLAILTAIFGISLGLVIAWLIDRAYSGELTTTAQLIMAPRDLTLEFHIFSIDLKIIGLVALSILVAALLASALPLLRNTRRNPIKDMRDE